MLRLTLEDLVGQVVDDIPIVPGKPSDEAGGIVAPLDRERGQLKGGDPALGAPLQRERHLAPPRSSPITLFQVIGGLIGGEAQIRGADLDELATPAQATQRQRRVGAGGDHHV